MTLPTVGEQGEAGASNALRPAPRVVRNNETYILQNIKWSPSLQDGLVECGLLDADVQQVRKPYIIQ